MLVPLNAAQLDASTNWSVFPLTWSQWRSSATATAGGQRLTEGLENDGTPWLATATNDQTSDRFKCMSIEQRFLCSVSRPSFVDLFVKASVEITERISAVFFHNQTREAAADKAQDKNVISAASFDGQRGKVVVFILFYLFDGSAAHAHTYIWNKTCVICVTAAMVTFDQLFPV